MLHLTPRRFYALARQGFFSEELAERLRAPRLGPSDLRWISTELADSDLWKCINTLYELNSRPSDQALKAQRVGEGDAPPAAHPGCANLDERWWPDLNKEVSERGD